MRKLCFTGTIERTIKVRKLWEVIVWWEYVLSSKTGKAIRNGSALQNMMVVGESYAEWCTNDQLYCIFHSSRDLWTCCIESWILHISSCSFEQDYNCQFNSNWVRNSRIVFDTVGLAFSTWEWNILTIATTALEGLLFTRIQTGTLEIFDKPQLLTLEQKLYGFANNIWNTANCLECFWNVFKFKMNNRLVMNMFTDSVLPPHSSTFCNNRNDAFSSFMTNEHHGWDV